MSVSDKLTWEFTALSVAGFILATLFLPELFSPADTIRWAVVAAVLPIAAVVLPPRQWTLARVSGALLILWYFASIAWAANPYDALDSALKLAFIACAFEIGARIKSPQPVLFGIAAALALGIVFSLSQGCYFACSGLFDRSTHMGEAAALVFAGLLFDPKASRNLRIACIGISALAILMAGSKAGMLAVAAVGIMGWKIESFPKKLGFLVLLFIVAMIASQPTGLQRIDIWHDAFMQLTLFGHGAGSVWTSLPAHFDWLKNSRPEHLHNEFLEIAYETGFVGSILAAIFIASLWHANGSCFGLFIAFLVIALVNFPLHEPVTAVVFALCAGHIDRDGNVVCDILARWRMALLGGTKTGTELATASSGGHAVSFEPSLARIAYSS